MKRVELKFYQSSGQWGLPEYTNSEFVEFNTDEELSDYIDSLTDGYKHKYRKSESFKGYDYVSNAGALGVHEITFKTLVRKK